MAHMPLRAAAVQLASQANVAENLATCRRLVLEARASGAELVLLPENFAYQGPEAGKRSIAERLGVGGPILDALRDAARVGEVTLIAGGFPEAGDDGVRPYNTCVVVASDGAVAASYRKIHLFDVELPDGTKLLESEATTAGGEPTVVDVGGFKVGLSICYDLRFPELYRALVHRGAEVLVVPAAFTLQTGKDHWHVLLRARAIESQCWVIAAGQWGSRPKGPPSYGHSMIVDPWGTIVAEASDRVGVIVADVDRAYLDRVRGILPCLRHRRL
jgi:deaminated glutathione amidase